MTGQLVSSKFTTISGNRIVPITSRIWEVKNNAASAGTESLGTFRLTFGGKALSAPGYEAPAAVTSYVNEFNAQVWKPTSYSYGSGNGGTWTTVSALPPGLSINPQTGVIFGTPTTAGIYGSSSSEVDSLIPVLTQP